MSREIFNMRVKAFICVVTLLLAVFFSVPQQTKSSRLKQRLIASKSAQPQISALDAQKDESPSKSSADTDNSPNSQSTAEENEVEHVLHLPPPQVVIVEQTHPDVPPVVPTYQAFFGSLALPPSTPPPNFA